MRNPFLGLVVAANAALGASVAETNHFQFLTPQAENYLVDATAAQPATAGRGAQWVRARREGGTNITEFGSRVVVQLDSPGDLAALAAGRPLTLSRTINSNIFILQAPDAPTALIEAQRLAALPGVRAAYPVMRRHNTLHGPYAPRTNDPFFVPYFNTSPRYDSLWYLEDRDYNGTRLGIDLNVLAAWPYGQGQGVTVAVADTGLDLKHLELAARVAGAPHFDFDTNTSSVYPRAGFDISVDPQTWVHGTSVAGLIAATGNNNEGMVGVAPLASLASWLIYDTNEALVPDEQLLSMYEYASNTVSIQNHSWGKGNGTPFQEGPTLLEKVGINNAVTLGRGGLGTVMVRSAGNDRGSFDTSGLLSRADDDGYPDDPQVIAVGAVLKTGRATSYSDPGACLLLGAPGGDANNQGLFTLDVSPGVGTGVSTLLGDLTNYRFGPPFFPTSGFVGTSAAAPLVSGVAALVLSVNTNLTYRDVQQILLMSANHGDLADPDIVTNGAGFLVSHNVGFGIPNAGDAVRLAQAWTNRPPLTTVSVSDSQPLPIPDAGLRVETTGSGVPAFLASIPAAPGTGPQPDSPTQWLPLVDVGLATNVPSMDLTNAGALILRGGATFAQKISNAAQAGAAFAIIYGTSGDDSLVPVMIGDDFVPIPSVYIGNSNGVALQSLLQTNSGALVRLRLEGAQKTFHINSTLICEHVGVRLQTDHPRRGDLRITLQSPMGTRSILQAWNPDTSAGPVDWTYWTTHDFYESSAGDWTLFVGDETAGAAGAVLNATLMIEGTQITDTDHDGLDDNWEMANFGSLKYGPKDDPAGDGYTLARAQAMGIDPTKLPKPFAVDLSWWSLRGYTLPRLTWPGAAMYNYAIYGATNLPEFNLLTNLPGVFPETEFLGPPPGGSPGTEFFDLFSTPGP